jgi:nucleotide-binding universal stress UspA family protein
MTYKDILLEIDEATPLSRCELTVELAARCGGRVTGLYLKTFLAAQLADAGIGAGAPAADVVARILDRLERQDQNAAFARDVLQRVASAAGVDCEFHIVNGDTPHEMVAEARHADLVVVGPWSAESKGQSFSVDIVMGAGVPVLIVPAKIDHARVGARVLVAWNGSRESSSALRGALPILTDDAILEIRTVQYEYAPADLAALRRYLERHGCRMDSKAVDHEGRSVPQWLIGEAVEAGCDLIVMGLYGHMRQRDFLLSDVSRDMLQNSPLPLLISS